MQLYNSTKHSTHKEQSIHIILFSTAGLAPATQPQSTTTWETSKRKSSTLTVPTLSLSHVTCARATARTLTWTRTFTWCFRLAVAMSMRPAWPSVVILWPHLCLVRLWTCMSHWRVAWTQQRHQVPCAQELNIKLPSYQYRKSYCVDKTVETVLSPQRDYLYRYIRKP